MNARFLAVGLMLVFATAAFPVADNDVVSGFFRAVEKDDRAALESLLARHPGLIRVQDGEGRTGLHLAAWLGHTLVVRLLVARDADPNAEQGNAGFSSRRGIGERPLHLAVRGERDAVAEVLLSVGADHRLKNESRQSPLVLAEILQKRSMVLVLRRYGAGDPGRFFRAIADGEVDLARADLFAHPQWVRLQDPAHRGPLEIAVRNGRTAMTAFFLDRGLSADTRDYSGQTMLCIAAGEGLAEVATVLLDKGAVPDALSSGMTALHAAAVNGRDALVRLLVERGADPARRDRAGLTARELALRARHPSAASLLPAETE
jgi:ankyrin repeat protein